VLYCFYQDFLSKSDPYLQFERALPNGQFLTVHRTEFIKNNLNPTWLPFSLTTQQLCGENEEQELKVSCFDYDSDGGHDLIGIFTTTWKEMREATSREIQWECISPKKKSKKKYVNSGVVYLSSVKVKACCQPLPFYFRFIANS
jgi:Ca2+-dependent lipid-binding protein